MKTVEGNFTDQQIRNWLTLLFMNEAPNTRSLLSYIELSGMTMPEFATLPGKKILLVGGGMSRIKQNLQHVRITNVRIDNVDPYTKYSPECCDNLIKKDFFDFDATDEYDEVLPSYTYPAYALTDWQVQTFVPHAMRMLKPGGTLRVTGVSITPTALGLAKCPDMSLDQKFFNDFNGRFPKMTVGYDEKYVLSQSELFANVPDIAYISKYSIDISKYIQLYFMALPHFQQNMVDPSKPRFKSLTWRAPKSGKSEINEWLENYQEQIPRTEPIFSEAKIRELAEDQFVAGILFSQYQKEMDELNKISYPIIDRHAIGNAYRKDPFKQMLLRPMFEEFFMKIMNGDFCI